VGYNWGIVTSGSSLDNQISVSHIGSLLLLSGISGAGRSSALHTLSDYGFSIVDNLPVHLFLPFIELSRQFPEKYSRTALIIDIDTDKDTKDFISLLQRLHIGNCNLMVVFLDADTEVILRRYSETRRPHPGFQSYLDRSLEDTIRRERNLLDPVKHHANLIIDTSGLSIHELRRELRTFVDGLGITPENAVRVNFVSFGFKYGIPRDCDLVIDIRFLPNPHFVEGLREKTGQTKEVAQYVLSQPDAQAFLTRYSDLLRFLLPRYAFEGKSYINIGVGCTGGKHRSVCIAEELHNRNAPMEGFVFSVKHRDLKEEARESSIRLVESDLK
jgi:RNase adapter protein RapZ